MSNKGFALVTGASSGIGEAIAYQLAQKGYPVIITARRHDRLVRLKEKIEAECRVRVEILEADLAILGTGGKLHSQVVANQWEVEILVNNAGVGCQGDFEQLEWTDVERMLVLNIHALSELTMRFAKEMKERGRGRILQVASLAAFIDTPMVSAYAATKAYVRSFSNAVRWELKGTPVKITVLYPGITRTEFLEVAHAHVPKGMEISMLSASAVATAGLNGLFRGKRAVIPGFINKLNAFFAGLFPKSWITHFSGKLMRSAEN